MLIEAILNGKPCITIFPDKNKDLKKHNFTNILKELVYFKEFISNDLILTCDDSDTLINKTNELIKLSKNTKFSLKLIQHSKYFVQFPKPNYKINILNICDTMLKNSKVEIINEN